MVMEDEDPQDLKELHIKLIVALTLTFHEAARSSHRP